MNENLLYIIILLHFIFVIFVVITPFIGTNYFLLLHFITIPFLLIHWYTNNNNCVLTIIEKNIRHHLYGIEPDYSECFMYNLIAPVYDFKENNSDISVFLYASTISLWLYTCYRLYNNYKEGKLTKLEDLIFM